MCNKVNKKKMSFDDKVNRFFFTPKIFIVLGGILLFSILNYIFFSMSGKPGFEWAGTTNPYFGDKNLTGDSPYAWYGYLNITISSIGGLLTIFALILTVRLDKRFIYPILIGESLVLIDAILVGSIFTGISYFLMIFISIYNYFTWGNGGKDDVNRLTNVHKISLVLFLPLYIIFGLLLVEKTNFNGGIFGEPKDVWGNWYDVVGSGIVVVAYFMMYKKSKNSFILFLTTDLIYMIFFFQIGLWSTAASYIVYLFTDSSSMLTWWKKDKKLLKGKDLKVN